MVRYKLTLEIEIDEKESLNVEDLLSGAWIYDNMFGGAVIKGDIRELG